MKTWRNIVISLVLLAGVGIFRVPILGAVSALYNSTVRIVDSTGNVIDGTASAVSAQFNSTVRVVDSTGHVIDSFGGGGGTVTSVSGTVNQVAVATGTTTPVISLIGPYTAATYTSHGVLVGEGTSSIAVTAACAAGSVIYGQGAAADPICSTLILPNAATTGDLLAATSTNTIGRIAAVATGQVLASAGTGTAPVYTATPTLANMTKVNAQGAIAASGTLNCDLSLGNYCTFSGSSGVVTVAVPTNGVAGVQYYLMGTATGTFTITYATATPGWRIWNWAGGVDENPPSNAALGNTGISIIPFYFDGTNYRLNGETNVYANRIKAGTFTGGTISGTTGNFTGTLTGVAGTFSGLLNTQAVAVASLPATCVKNSIITVTDATSITAGVCVGGGSTSVLAICSATNTWSCL